MRFSALLLAIALTVGPRASAEPRTALVDLSADTLAPGAWELGMVWGRVSRGIVPGLQLSTHALGWPFGALNLFGKWQFVDRPELRASVEGGAVWLASAALLADGDDTPVFLVFPFEARASVPLSQRFELHLGAVGRWSVAGLAGAGLSTTSLRLDVSLSRTDASGAWVATGRFPLLTRAGVRMDSLLGVSDVAGALMLDDLASWGLVLARDQLIGDRLHLRFGVGYRNTYGILLYESLGHLLMTFDLYWRRPPA